MKMQKKTLQQIFVFHFLFLASILHQREDGASKIKKKTLKKKKKSDDEKNAPTKKRGQRRRPSSLFFFKVFFFFFSSYLCVIIMCSVLSFFANEEKTRHKTLVLFLTFLLLCFFLQRAHKKVLVFWDKIFIIIAMSFQSFVDMMQGGGGGGFQQQKSTTSSSSSPSSVVVETNAMIPLQAASAQQNQQQIKTNTNKRKFLKTSLIVCGWFASTVLLISFNKILMRDGSKFRLPIFLTFMHMCVAYVCCEIVLSFKERSLVVAAFNSSSGSSGSSSGSNKSSNSAFRVSARQQLQSNRQFWKIFALSQTFAVSIVAAVASLEYLEVSFEQAIAACTPAVTAFMGMVILRKKEHWRVWASLTPVILGGMVTAGAEPTFHAKGLALVLASMVARATKSCLQELLLSSAESEGGVSKDGVVQQSEKLDSLNSLRWMSLMSVCTLLPASVEFEGVCAIKAALRSAYEENDLAWALCANCAGAFLVNISQFLVTQHVGALSMQVLGNVKTIVTVVFSVVIFKNVVGLRSMLGYALTLIGCFVYLREKRRREAIENNNNINNELVAPLVGNTENQV
jgi:drug/metabolite transporter (DMT)-like permease